MIVAYRRKSDGRVLMVHPLWYYKIIVLATSSLPVIHTWDYRIGSYHNTSYRRSAINKKFIDDEVNKGELEHVDLLELKFLHPHLLKEVKKYFEFKGLLKFKK